MNEEDTKMKVRLKMPFRSKTTITIICQDYFLCEKRARGLVLEFVVANFLSFMGG